MTIDTLIDCLDSQQEIDVKSTVTKLRMRRMDMVQSVVCWTAKLRALYTN